MTINRNVTIKDIAKELKLSASTVSRALRGGSEIKPETRQLIQDLARKLNYSPNPIALSLKEKRSKVIGVIVPEIDNTFCSSAISGIEEIAYSRGYHVTIFQSHEKLEREITSTGLVASRRMDGLIISISNETKSGEHIAALMENGIPVVMFDRVLDELDTHKVMVDDEDGAYQATRHLIEQGFDRIAHLTISPSLSITRNRLNGYTRALTEAGLTLNPGWIHHCSFEPGNIEQAVRSLFSSADKPNAILASAERIVLRSLPVLQELNVRIPEDCALIGFSDNPLNQFLSPSLSSVMQPTIEIGKKSAELLINQIELKTTGNLMFKLPTKISKRNSSKGF